MIDPYFEATVAEIRGLDLGDDASLLASLDAHMAQGLTGDQWLLRAVLMHRAGRPKDAVQSLDNTVGTGHCVSQALYLKSCMLRDLDQVGEALEVLEEAREAATSDGLLSTAQLAHAQGLLFWKVGDRQEALIRVDEAIAGDEHSAARWLHRGQLLVELSRPDEAAKAFDRALLEEQDLDQAMIERAALEAGRGDEAAAAQWLAKAIRVDPEHRRRIATDVRFTAVRKHEALAEHFSMARSAELNWLDGLATWMGSLRRNGELARRGVEWLSQAHSERLGKGLQADHEQGPLGTIHTEATLQRSRELLQTRRVVALGPGSRTREGVVERSLILVDTARPRDGVWVAPSRSYPPFLWIRVDPDPAALKGALSEVSGRARRTRMDMPRQARGFLGYWGQLKVPSPYTGGVEPATIVELERHFALNPFVESTSWGSAHDDDPWPDQIPRQPGLAHKVAEHQRRVSEQTPGHVWSQTWRTRHSRSYLTLEVHHEELFVAQVRYRPSAFVETIEAMNAYFGCDYPTDMPVDAVAALLGFAFDGARDLEAELPGATDAEQIAGLLLVLSALRHGDLGALALLRRYVDHPAAVVRSTLGDIAVAHNLEVLLEEMSVREPDAGLRQDIEAVLDEGIPEPDADPFSVETLEEADVEPA